MRALSLAWGVLFGLVGCDGGGRDDPAPADATTTLDGAPSGGDACAPLTCPANACGPLDDGCGGVLDCGICRCDPQRFGADCPPRPCELPLSCEAGECRYTPVTCGGAVCRCPEGGCTEDTPRACGFDVCPADYCDPSPSVEAGVVTYGNRCVGPPERPCGLCGLGRERCDPVIGGLACVDLELPGLDPGEVECDSERDGSTFLYVDADFDGGRGDGSRLRPFRELNDAIEAGGARNARGIIIGGAPTFTAPFRVIDGVSLYGGYTRSPEFAPDPDLRPRIEVDRIHAAEGRLVAVEAVDISRPTLLSNLVVRTPDLLGTPGAHSYGIRAVRAPGLILVDLDVQIGAAGHGAAGSTGAPGPQIDADLHGALGRDVGANDGGICEAGGQEFYCGGRWGEVLGGEGGQGTLCADGRRSPAGGRGGPGRYTCPGPQSGDLGLPALPPEGRLSGAPGVPDGAVGEDGYWQSAGDGRPGRVGQHGAGGRGGFGGVRPYPMCGLGPSGGGGGAGGCGGAGGRGGQGGGWTFALFMVDSPGLTLVRGRYAAGPGGDGGPGGEGGPGAHGGRGGPPGGGAESYGYPPTGGDDGDPGHPGGHGGNGAGGGSIAVLCEGGAPDAPSLPALASAAGGAGANGIGPPAAPGPSAWLRGCNR